jgi:hypothetical protein
VDTRADTEVGGIYEVRRLDGPKFQDTHAKFHEIWFSNTKVINGIDTQATCRLHKHPFMCLSK